MNATRPPVLESLPGYAIARAFRVLRHEMDKALRDLELTTPQWGTLACLSKSKGLTGAEMARMHHLTPQTMHTILQNLETSGLIVREPHPDRGTLLPVRLTAAGDNCLVEATRRVREVHDRMLRGFDERECEMLGKLLHRCMEALAPEGTAESEIPCLE